MPKFMETNVDNFKFRFAQEEDVPVILQFIKELSEYENMLDEVTTTEEFSNGPSLIGINHLLIFTRIWAPYPMKNGLHIEFPAIL